MQFKNIQEVLKTKSCPYDFIYRERFMFAELPSLGFQASHETTVKRNTCDFQASDETYKSLSEFLWYATNGDHMMYY